MNFPIYLANISSKIEQYILTDCPCKGSSVCREPCRYHIENTCKVRSVMWQIRELAEIAKQPNDMYHQWYEIRAGDYWISKRKFTSEVEAWDVIPWVAYLLNENKDNIKVVPCIST